MVAAAIRTIFAQPTAAEVIEQLDKVTAMLAPKFPQVATMLVDAREDLTAFHQLPGLPLGQALEHQRLGTPEQRGQATHQRRGDLP